MRSNIIKRRLNQSQRKVTEFMLMPSELILFLLEERFCFNVVLVDVSLRVLLMSLINIKPKFMKRNVRNVEMEEVVSLKI